MKQRMLERIDLRPTGRPAAGCVVVLHGRGVTGEDLVPVARELDLPGLRYVFPHAPLECGEFSGGRAWYEVFSRDHEGILESRGLLFNLLREIEEEGIAPGQIALMGFSQGAVMGLDVGVRYEKRLGGVIALSGYLYAPEGIRQEKSTASAGLPIFLAHGTEDEVLPLSGARHAASVLAAEGFKVLFREYTMGHQVIPDELDEVRDFLATILPRAS